jgi:hypothetical protein
MEYAVYYQDEGKWTWLRQTALGQSANSRQYLGCIHRSRMGHSIEARLVTRERVFEMLKKKDA